MQNVLTLETIFPVSIYTIQNIDFLQTVKNISKQFILKAETDLGFVPDVLMTENLEDPSILDFAKFIHKTSWDILSKQGYAMEYFNTQITELWCHQYQPNSYMERHIHGNNSVISGFYFLDCPENCSKVVFHDSNAAKVITSLPESDSTRLTAASIMANYGLQEGTFMFTNSWLPHSFTQNLAKTPLRFIHFNVTVTPIQQNTNVEVI